MKNKSQLVPVLVELFYAIPFPRAKIWPILSKTDWLNRSLGLPAVTYDIQPLPEGGTAVWAKSRLFGRDLICRELPFEWVEPCFYTVRRLYRNGPFREIFGGMQFEEIDRESTRLRVFSEFAPRSVWGGWLARRVVARQIRSGMNEAVAHVVRHLSGAEKTVLPKLGRSPVFEEALGSGLKKLCALNLPPNQVERLELFLRQAPDVEVARIRPLSVARQWGEDGWDVLRLFLHATRSGLLDLSWEVLCPNCRSSGKEWVTSLAEVKKQVHCEACQIGFDAEFDKSVELKFSVNPMVRPRTAEVFCLAGPGSKPHISSQIVVNPEQSRRWDLPEIAGPCRVRSPQVAEAIVLPQDDAGRRRGKLSLRCDRQKFSLEWHDHNGSEVAVTNPNPYAALVIFEKLAWDEDVLTASRVTNWQEFRDLFASEVVSPEEQITVGSQIVLFTDLRGSTSMYNGLGDAPAYAVVRQHFRALQEVIARHHGGIVKTIGDAVMAVFSQLEEGLEAVWEMHEEVSKIPLESTNGPGQRLRLKASLHVGPCLAVQANNRLDYFGTTVNLAARMVTASQGDDLVVSDELYRRPETVRFWKKACGSAEAAELIFRGFERPQKIWRIPVRR